MTPLSTTSAALAVLVSWRAPAHRTLAVALVAAKVIELARPGLPPREAMAALLALPALSAWSTLRALAWRRAGAPCAALWVAAAAWTLWGDARPRWEWIWPTALVVSVVVEVVARWRWRRSDGTIGVTQRTAAALSAGDVGGLLIGLAFGWSTRWLAEGVAVVTCAIQGVWFLRQRRR